MVVSMSVVVTPSFVLAEDPPASTVRQPDGSATTVRQPNDGSFSLKNPLKVDSVGGLVQNFIEIFSYLAILVAVLAIIWVGFRFIWARGDPTEMNKLKDWLMWIVVGVAVVIGARLIIQIVINTLSSTGTVDERTIQSVKKAVNGN